MCGIFGIYENENAAVLVCQGLHGLQHRGQESAGIAIYNGEKIITYRAMGMVQKIFTLNVLEKLQGKMAIGHNRYSTVGFSEYNNSQPISVDCQHGQISIAHNGTLSNADYLRNELKKNGSIFQTTTDTEIILHLIAKNSQKEWLDNIVFALKKIEGAYSLLFLTNEEIIAVRDPRGFRPLCIGSYQQGYIFSSELNALTLIGGEFIREIEPGEIIRIKEGKFESFKDLLPKADPRFCIFEFIYFARPDSVFNNKNVYQVRKELGKQLAREKPVSADIVIDVPDSGTAMAKGYADESKMYFETGLIRSHYIGRIFIDPGQEKREVGVKMKLSPLKSTLYNKKIVVIDDSIVRGTTFRKVVRMLRKAGAKEIHIRVASPPIIGPCFYGIDTPKRKELLAPNKNIKEICAFLEADSLGYLSVEGMLKVIGENYCDACFTLNYPIKSDKLNI